MSWDVRVFVKVDAANIPTCAQQFPHASKSPASIAFFDGSLAFVSCCSMREFTMEAGVFTFPVIKSFTSMIPPMDLLPIISATFNCASFCAFSFVSCKNPIVAPSSLFPGRNPSASLLNKNLSRAFLSFVIMAPASVTICPHRSETSLKSQRGATG